MKRSSLCFLLATLFSFLNFAACRNDSRDQLDAETSKDDHALREAAFAQQLSACEDPQLETTEIRLTETPVNELDLDLLQPESRVETLVLDQGVVTDDSIKSIAQVQSLRSLRLRHSPVTDQSIELFSGMHSLAILNLPQADFTDARLDLIGNMRNLELFRFGSPRVTDQGVRRLLKSESIRFLHLIHIPVSDAILDDLIANDTLESLYIDGGNLTENGIERLLKDKPDLHIHFDQRHHDLDPTDSVDH